MIFTSLLLLLCQSEPSIIGPVTFTPAQPQESTQNPDLVLDTATWADYRMAMHLIDVRGRYDEGTAKLLQLVDQPDVIVFPGQASWMLAQAARALTLAGKNEEAAKYIPGARNGSRGTPLEVAIDSLLASFAPQSAGLDPAFLEFVRDRLETTDSNPWIGVEYGRDILPYLKFIIENQDGEEGLLLQYLAFTGIFQMLDSSSGAWIQKKLLHQPPLLTQGMMRLLAKSLKGFIDLEAREVAGHVLIAFAEQSPEAMHDLALDSLLRYAHVFDKKEGLISDLGSVEKVSQAIQNLFEQGRRGSKPSFLTSISSFAAKKNHLFQPLLFNLIYSENLVVQEEARWLLGVWGGHEDLRFDLADGGSSADHIRLCLKPSRFVEQYSLLYENMGGKDSELRAWGMPQVKNSLSDRYLSMYSVYKPVLAENLEAFTNLSSSHDPFVRFLAAAALLNGDFVDEAAVFLKELGENPQWANYLLHYWAKIGKPMTTEAWKILEPLVESSPLQNEIYGLLESQGSLVLSASLIEKYSLSPSAGTQYALTVRAEKEGAVEELIWVMMNGDIAYGAHRNASLALARGWPAEFLRRWDSLKADGERSKSMDWRSIALKALLDQSGADSLVEFKVELRDFLIADVKNKGGSNNALQLIVADPDLFVQIMRSEIAEGPPTLNWYTEQRADPQRALEKLRNKEAGAQLATELIEKGYWAPFDSGQESFWNLIPPASEYSVAAYEALWNQESISYQVALYRLRKTISSLNLRRIFRANLLEELQNSPRRADLCSAYIAEGAVQEILDELLELLASNPQVDGVVFLIRAVGTIDDDRVIPVLMNFLDDPRPGVGTAASSALTRIQTVREQKRLWESWANGDGGGKVSPTEALLENLKDPDLEIRLVSIESLGTLGEKDALPALINLLRDEDPQIKAAARKALDRINHIQDPAVVSKEQAKMELTMRKHMVGLELAKLQETKTEQHPDVVAAVRELESIKKQLRDLESD